MCHQFRAVALISSAARKDNGTSRLSPFLVIGRWAIRRRIFTSAHFRPQISPARMAVSMANRTATATRCTAIFGFSLGRYRRAAQISAISCSVGRLVLARLFFGLLILRTGFSRRSPHSFMACSQTADKVVNSRPTLVGDTSCNR